MEEHEVCIEAGGEQPFAVTEAERYRRVSGSHGAPFGSVNSEALANARSRVRRLPASVESGRRAAPL